MALLGSLQVRLGLDTATFSQKFQGFTKDIEKRAKGLQKGLAGLTNIGNLLGGAGIGAALTSGINTAAAFESSMDQVGAASDATAEQMRTLSDMALEFGKNSVFSANEVAAAMLDLAKAGINPEQMGTGTLAATLQLAATEGMDLSRAAEIMAEQMGAFKLAASDGAAIADALAGASIASTASVEGLAQGLSQTAATASLSGATLQETAGLLALLAQNGIKGSDAGTSLKTMFLRLVPATDAAANTMKALGLNFTNADGSFKRITEVADQLRAKLGPLSAAQRQSALQTIFGTDAFRAAAILTKSQTGELEKYIEATRDKAAAEKLGEARVKGFSGAMLQLKNAISATFTEATLENGSLGWLTTGAQKVTEFVKRISEAPPWMTKLGLGLASAAAAAPFLAFAIANIAAAVPAVLTGIGAIAGVLTGPFGIALAAGVAAWVLFKDEILAGIQGIRQWFTGWVSENQGNLSALGAAWQGFIGTLGPLWEQIKISVETLAQAFASAFGADSSALFASFKELASAALTGIVQGITWLLGKATEFSVWIAGKLPEITQGIITFATQAVQLFQSVGDYIQTKFGPLFESFKNLMVAAFDLVRAAVQLWWEAFSQIMTAAGQKIAEFAAWVSQTEQFKASIELLGRAFQAFGEAAKKWVDIALGALKSLYDKGANFLKGLTDKIDAARRSLNLFGDAGEKETDRAVGNSWLTDLCEKGIANFQALIGSGINPAAQALQGLGSVGSGVRIGTMENPLRAQTVNGKTLNPLTGEAENFESAWGIATRNVQGAMDDLVRNGEISFKGLVNSIIADFASAQLSKAVSALFQGISGAVGGTGGGWGSIISGVIGAFGSFEGGGYTGNGARTGGLDGKGGRLAMIHPRETVIDHTKVRSGARGNGRAIHVSTPITLMPGVSHEELGRILPQLQKQIIQIIPELVQRGGRYASAFGV